MPAVGVVSGKGVALTLCVCVNVGEPEGVAGGVPLLLEVPVLLSVGDDDAVTVPVGVVEAVALGLLLMLMLALCEPVIDALSEMVGVTLDVRVKLAL